MNDYLRWKRRRWTEVLSEYRARKHLTVQQLAEFLQKPKFSVRMWLSGKRAPHQKDLASLCALLKLDYKSVLSREMATDLLFEERILGFDTLQLRYLEVHQRDAFAAMNLVLIGGCLTFTYLLKAGFQARLENNSSFGSKICFLTEGLNSYLLHVLAKGKEGIGFEVLDQSIKAHIDWRPLHAMNLDALITFLAERLATATKPDHPGSGRGTQSATDPKKEPGA